MTEQKKRVRIITPKLTLKFPKLTEPDYGNKEYPKPDGEFSTKGLAREDDPAIVAFLTKLQPLYDEAMAEAEQAFSQLKVETRKKLGKVTRNPIFTTVYDQETEEPTGEIEFKFAMNASGERKKGPKAGTRWTMSPDIFDAAGNPLRKPPQIWGGTVAKISFEPRPYFIPGTGAAGLKLALAGVQIIDLVTKGARSAASHGFGAEDGYSYEAEDEESGGFGDSSAEQSAAADTAGDERVEF